MKVNINVDSYAISKKLETPKQSTKKEEFKKVLDNHETNSKKPTNENVSKERSKELDDEAKQTTVEGSVTQNLNNDEKVNMLKSKVLEFIETFSQALKQGNEGVSNELKGQDKSIEEMEQIQQILQSLTVMFQSAYEDAQTKDKKPQDISINLEQLLGSEKLTSSSKETLRSNISEILAMLEKSKGNTSMNPQVIAMIQKLTNEVTQESGELNFLKSSIVQVINPGNEDKSIKDNLLKNNLLKEVVGQSTNIVSDVTLKNQMQNSRDTSKDNKSSGNNSFEEKFLSNFLSEDKDENKIAKVVNFMNQFEAVKTIDTPKVQTPNIVIDKSNLGADVIKGIKFMETNNIKDLTVKMNPKELGEITIKIVVESGIMKASISAQNKETYNLLNQNIQDISDKLKSMDIKIQSLDINIYEDSTFFNKDSNGRNAKGEQNNNSKATMSIEEDIAISDTYAIEENQVNMFV